MKNRTGSFWRKLIRDNYISLENAIAANQQQQYVHSAKSGLKDYSAGFAPDPCTFILSPKCRGFEGPKASKTAGGGDTSDTISVGNLADKGKIRKIRKLYINSVFCYLSVFYILIVELVKFIDFDVF